MNIITVEIINKVFVSPSSRPYELFRTAAATIIIEQIIIPLSDNALKYMDPE